MNQPLMGGEQTNVPQNEEELAAGLARAQAASEAEEAAHLAARKNPTAPSPEQIQIGTAFNAQFIAMWDLAMATGNLTHYINAALFNAAVILANAKTHGEGVHIIEYIEKTAGELKAKKQTIGEK